LASKWFLRQKQNKTKQKNNRILDYITKKALAVINKSLWHLHVLSIKIIFTREQLLRIFLKPKYNRQKQKAKAKQTTTKLLTTLFLSKKKNIFPKSLSYRIVCKSVIIRKRL